MQLTLFIPELIWPEPEDHETLDGLACTALNTLLARSQLSSRPSQSLEATLTDAFGLPGNPPYAALRLLGEPGVTLEVAGECWINADPVHLRFEQDRLILADSGSFGIEAEESRALADALNQHFSEIGRFHSVAADRWYLHLADTTLLDSLDAPPLSAVAGRSIEQFFSGKTRASRLHKLLNEAQMLLHSHPVNQQRERTRQLPINSLWLWGAGMLPARNESDFDGVWSTHPLALGLARAAGVPTHPVPVDAATFFEHAASDTSHLIVLEDLLGAIQYQDGESYRNALTDMESRWFAPVRNALTSGKIASLRIESSTVYATLTWDSTRRDQWKFWRHPRPLAEIAQDLAKGST